MSKNIKFKGLVKRGSAFALAVSLLAGITVASIPSLTYADALNPLTERTLLLSSSSPGHNYLDAAGNGTYAQPGSGPNGQKTEESFSFKVSTNHTNSGVNPKNKIIKALTFQYCTTAAGDCNAPGNNDMAPLSCATAPGTPCANTSQTNADLNVNYSSPVQNQDFEIYVGGVLVSGTAWTMSTSNHEENAADPTGQQNFITLVNAASTLQPVAGTQIRIVFKADADDYITNPGAGAFFVKINTYDTETTSLHQPTTDTNVIDGGVTVANVMTDSIQIQTKVLETMSFSVGTKNPDFSAMPGNIDHGSCDAINENLPINLGLQAEEFSLRTDTAFDGKSYWRLSSNSSNGASVYYSGYTLSNTVGDQINAVGTSSQASNPGTEQFGLAYDSTAETPHSDTGVDPAGNINTPAPLVVPAAYNDGSGTIIQAGTASFAFDTASDQVPALLASDNNDVVECATGKMRYIANIAAATPSGIYSSKINYLASPMY